MFGGMFGRGQISERTNAQAVWPLLSIALGLAVTIAWVGILGWLMLEALRLVL